MLGSSKVHRTRICPELGFGIVYFGAGEPIRGVKPARNQHQSVRQQRGGIVLAWRIHRARPVPLSGCRIKFFRAGYIFKTPGNQNQPAGQQRSGVQFASLV